MHVDLLKPLCRSIRYLTKHIDTYYSPMCVPTGDTNYAKLVAQIIQFRANGPRGGITFIHMELFGFWELLSALDP